MDTQPYRNVISFHYYRGADPNDVDNKGTTPLMIAAKLGRDENIEELMSVTVEEADNDMDLEDADDVIEGSKERKPGQVKRVMIDGKHKKTTKAPIHYAAKNGHEVGFIPPPQNHILPVIFNFCCQIFHQ